MANSIHDGGFEVKFWFDSGDGLWHAWAFQEYTDATLEGALKKAQAIFPALGQAGNFDPCFAVGISDKTGL